MMISSEEKRPLPDGYKFQIEELEQSEILKETEPYFILSVLTDNNEVVGWLDFGIGVAQGEQALISFDVHILPEHRLRGLATALYDEVERCGKIELTPSETQTLDGKAFWDSRLKKKGRSSTNRNQTDL